MQEGLESHLLAPRAPGLVQAPLQGKVAMVTGASSGIGEATAEALAAAGAAVAVGARRTDRLDDLVQRLTDRGSEGIAMDLDVRDADACAAAVQRTVDELGALDILVNNAGGDAAGADRDRGHQRMGPDDQH